MERRTQTQNSPEMAVEAPSKLQTVLENTEHALRDRFKNGKSLNSVVTELNSTISTAWERVQTLFQEGGIITRTHELILNSELEDMPSNREGHKILGSGYYLRVDAHNTASCLEIGTDGKQNSTLYRRIGGSKNPVKSEGYLNAVEKFFTKQISELPASSETLIGVLNVRNGIALQAIAQAIEDQKPAKP